MADAASYGMDKELAEKRASKYDVGLEVSVAAWIEAVTGEGSGGQPFAEWLKNGQVLCKLANAIRPGIVKKVNTSQMPFKQMENITMFVNAARELGVPESAIFSTPDLFEEKHMGSVVNCIHTLGGVIQASCPDFKGPALGPAINVESRDKKRESQRLLTDQSSGLAASMEVARPTERVDYCVRSGAVQGPTAAAKPVPAKSEPANVVQEAATPVNSSSPKRSTFPSSPAKPSVAEPAAESPSKRGSMSVEEAKAMVFGNSSSPKKSAVPASPAKPAVAEPAVESPSKRGSMSVEEAKAMVFGNGSSPKKSAVPASPAKPAVAEPAAESPSKRGTMSVEEAKAVVFGNGASKSNASPKKAPTVATGAAKEAGKEVPESKESAVETPKPVEPEDEEEVAPRASVKEAALAFSKGNVSNASKPQQPAAGDAAESPQRSSVKNAALLFGGGSPTKAAQSPTKQAREPKEVPASDSPVKEAAAKNPAMLSRGAPREVALETAFMKSPTKAADQTVTVVTPKAREAPTLLECVYGMDKELQAKQEAKLDKGLEAQVSQWVEELSGTPRDGQSLAEWLKNGQVLCAAVNTLRPGIVKKVNSSSMPFKQMENLSFFVNAARELGVPESAVFSSPDLFEERNIPSVVNCLYTLGGAVQVSCPDFTGPRLGVAMAVESKSKKRGSGICVDQSAGLSSVMENNVVKPMVRS